MTFGKFACAIAVAATLLTTAACGRPGVQSDRHHGTVVASLPLPYSSPGGIVRVNVTVGQRFSVKVATSDGPLYWREIGPKPAARVVKRIGDFNQGHCAAHVAGCRVPYFHTLLALHRGTTTMSWRYRYLTCTANCVKAATVKFVITVS